ncbi:MAG: hypothetical protein IH840_10205 [Candidatus Heimdallarchaeota archaeon]|nr:hypothetical protein [Candidatus Heimdallarchaeota archaeon]
MTSFLLSLLVSTTTFLIYRNNRRDIFPFTEEKNNDILPGNEEENNVEAEIDQIQWAFDSGPSLSNQLSDEIDKLMFFKIDAGYRIKNPTGGYHYESSIQGIGYNVTGIEAWLYSDDVVVEDGTIGEIQRPIAGSWRMWIDSVISENRSIDPSKCPNDIFCGFPQIEFGERENMNHLFSSFNQDMANIGNFSDVTHNGTEEVAFLNSEIEVLYWRITHVYMDGSFMEFYIFDDVLIIRHTPLEVFLISEGGVAFGPVINNVNSVSFKVKIDGAILPNYIDGINLLLTSIVIA